MAKNKKDRTIKLTVNFPVELTKKGSVSKATMKKCCKEVFRTMKRDKIRLTDSSDIVFCEILDSNKKQYYFDFMKFNYRTFFHDFSFSITFFQNDCEVNTTLWIDYENGQHRELDYFNSEIEVSID